MPASPTGTPTVDAFPTIERPPTPTATPQGAIVGIGAPEPLDVSPLATLPEAEVPPYVFDVEISAVVEPGTPAFASAMESYLPIRSIDVDLLAIRTSDGSWVQATLRGLNRVVVAPDGLTAAISLNARVLILDRASLTTRELSLRVTPVSFSPDGKRLLVTHSPVSDPPRSGYIVVPLEDPTAAARLPLGSAPGYDSQHTPRWLSDSRILLLTQNPDGMQIIETSGAQPEVVVEHELPSDKLAVSPDGSKLALQVGRRPGDEFPPRAPEDDHYGVEVYSLDPLELSAFLEGASLGQYSEVPSEVWAPDGARLLVALDYCGDAERLVSYDFTTDAYTELARGGFLYWIVSPDNRWVAYTAWPREGWVVPADGSSPAVRAADEVHATSRPFWSGDSRYARFTPYGGGYDRCLA